MYDVIIIGAGPAGLTAAAYSARSMLKTLVIERYPLTGGQMLLTDVIANFPAYVPSDGSEIAKNLKAQAEEAGVRNGDIVSVKFDGPRALTFDEVVVRAGDTHERDMHLDTDEANAAGLSNGQLGEIIK